MGPGYIILNWSTKSIITGLSKSETLAAARVLMQLPTPSFDIMEESSRTIVTGEFTCDSMNYWRHTPNVSEHVRSPEMG